MNRSSNAGLEGFLLKEKHGHLLIAGWEAGYVYQDSADTTVISEVHAEKGKETGAGKQGRIKAFYMHVTINPMR